jgi:hypothetical protein
VVSGNIEPLGSAGRPVDPTLLQRRDKRLIHESLLGLRDETECLRRVAERKIHLLRAELARRSGGDDDDLQ